MYIYIIIYNDYISGLYQEGIKFPPPQESIFIEEFNQGFKVYMTKGAKFPPRRILYLLRIQSGVQASFEESTSPRKFLYALKSFTKGFKFV